ncbi:MAG: STAS domain-containing protein [Frankiaceae bacterium]|nr:STAS domain-containing protein [Frankiaceae bacterium]
MAAPDTPSLRISEAVDGATTVLTLSGELDLATAELLRTRVRALVGRGAEVRHLVLDLSDLTFLDVTGLGALLEARRKLTGAGGSLLLRRPRPMVLRMLELLHLDEALQVEH